MSEKKFRRKLSNYFIEPQFQTRYVTFLAIASGIPTLVACGIVVYGIKDYSSAVLNCATGDVAITESVIWGQSYLIQGLILVFSIHFLCIVLLGVVFSHRVAGVIYRLRQSMKALTEGSESQLTLRKNDEFQFIADEFNQMVKSLKGKRTP